MPDRETDRMTLARFGEIVEAYGVDPVRWPAKERAAAEMLRAGSDDARRLHANAAALDTLLNLSSAPVPSPELMARVLVGADRPRRRSVFAGFWPFETIWRPASAFAMAATMGIVLGAAAPDAILPGLDDVDFIGEIESLALGFDLAEEPGA